MNLSQAFHYGFQLLHWIEPYCERVEIAGSIRRGRPNCNDVDLVVIPKIDVQKDLLGAQTMRRNLVALFIAEYLEKNKGRASLRCGDSRDPEILSLNLPKVQLDIFFATEATWASRLLCRTGSAAHNIKLCNRAKDLGLQWKPQLGIVRDTQIIPAKTEEDIFTMLQMDYVQPQHREV